MATLGTMKTRIADEIARADLTSQIALAIASAVQFYETRRFWFLETEGTFNTISGTDAYTTSTATFISTLIDDDSVTATISGDRTPMVKLPFSAMQPLRLNTDPEGPPKFFSFYRQRMYLHPVPDAAYTITVYYLTTLGVPGADGSSNAWTTEAEELIRLHAKVDLFENVIRDFAEADRMRAREADVLRRLDALSNRRTAAGMVVAEYH